MMETMLLCIALNVWFEARGEVYDGQLAVAEVTRRRVEDSRFPDNACDVVYQPRQFEWTAKYGSPQDTPVPSPSLPSWQRAVKAAKESEESQVTSCADHFYNPRFVTPEWDRPPQSVIDRTVGGHKFVCVTW